MVPHLRGFREATLPVCACRASVPACSSRLVVCGIATSY